MKYSTNTVVEDRQMDSWQMAQIVTILTRLKFKKILGCIYILLVIKKYFFLLLHHLHNVLMFTELQTVPKTV